MRLTASGVGTRRGSASGVVTRRGSASGVVTRRGSARWDFEQGEILNKVGF